MDQFKLVNPRNIVTILKKILFKGMVIPTTFNNNVIYNIIKTGKNDQEIYASLLAYYNTLEPQKDSNTKSKRGEGIAKIIKKLLQNRKLYKYVKRSTKKYLDVGAGDCSITKEIGAALGIGKKNIYGLELKENDDHYIGKHDYSSNVEDLGCIYKTYDGLHMPFDDNTFDYVSLLMVLHHVGNDDTLDKFVKEVKRIMKPDGVLIVREHNCDSEEMKAIIDIEHITYEVINQKKEINNYHAWYKSAKEWNEFMGERGFKVYDFPIIKNPNNSYYVIYKL